MTTVTIEAAWTTVEATVRGYLLRRLSGDDLADDLVHEVFLRMRRSLATLRSANRIGPWTGRIARSVLIDHLRRTRRTVALTADGLPEPEADNETPDLTGLAAYAQAQVEALPAHEADAVRLVDLQGVPPAQAAIRLGIGLPALKARLRRGRQRLRVAIDRCCEVVLDARGRPTTCEVRPQSPPCTSCA